MEQYPVEKIRYFLTYITSDFRLPAIISDMDGVVLRGSSVIGNSDKMIKEIFTPRERGAQIPFALMTNSGGFTEDKLANQMNERLKLDSDDKMQKMNKTHIIECHTPLTDRKMLEKYKDSYILIAGYDEVLKVALSYGYHKAIYVDELAAIYPSACPCDLPV